MKSASWPILERWALFRSAQFVWNFAFSEEFLGTEAWPAHPQYFVPAKGKRYLSILRTTKIVTCIFEFASRMASRQLLDPGAIISLELHGVDGRELSYLSARPRLEEPHWSRTESIQIERSVSPQDLLMGARELALDVTIEIFKNFGWLNPPQALLAEEQARSLAG
jgi:hypothetical protein